MEGSKLRKIQTETVPLFLTACSLLASIGRWNSSWKKQSEKDSGGCRGCQRSRLPVTELPKPIAITRDAVVLSRAGWNAIIEALDDATARTAVRASVRRAETGQNDGLPAALYRRLRAGEHPIRVS